MIKKSFFIFFPITFLFFQLAFTKDGCRSKANVQESIDDSLLLQKLKLIDKRKYIGLTVDSFMKEETISKFKDHAFIDHPFGYLSYLFLEYSKEIHIDILVNDYKYIIPYNIKRDWTLSVYRKEKIEIISLYNGRQLIEEFGRVTKFAN
jgi:hypothetical protein